MRSVGALRMGRNEELLRVSFVRKLRPAIGISSLAAVGLAIIPVKGHALREGNTDFKGHYRGPCSEVKVPSLLAEQ